MDKPMVGSSDNDMVRCMVTTSVIEVGNPASLQDRILSSKRDVVIVLENDTSIKTKGWEDGLMESVMSNRNGVSCSAFCPVSGQGLFYGGHLDVLVPRGGGAVVLEPRWNKEPSLDGKAECVMGGAYAFAAEWYRKFLPLSGIKVWNKVALAAISLKARLSGGSCVVAKNVVSTTDAGHDDRPTFPIDVAYGKMRLAFAVLPPRFSTIVPTLLAGSPGLAEATARFMADFRDIVRERDEFWAAVGTDPESATRAAGISLDVPITISRKAG